jgi:hypothetical protein
MSLIDCIRKSGKALNPRDADAISSIADELESSGIDRTEAEIQAVDQHLATLESDIEAMLPESLKQSAYHGTPHQFDEFSLEAMGTGEGAQAYGWGLYFAGNKSIAEYYRDALSGGKVKDQIKRALGFPESYELNLLADMLQSNNGDLTKSLVELREYAETFNKEGDISSSNSLMQFHDLVINKFPDGGTLGKDFKDNFGQLMQVNLPEDSDLLDHDKLLKDQPEKVQAALETIRQQLEEADILDQYLDELNSEWDELTGAEFYQVVKRAGTDDALPTLPVEFERALRDDERASMYLDSLGVKGLKFLDDTSRKKGNNVTYQGKKVNVAKETDPERLAAAYIGTYGRDQAVAMLRMDESSNPAVYSPAIGKVSFVDDADIGDGTTHNYVIWDDKTISVEAVNEEKRQAALYQQGDETPRGMFQVLDGKPTISLSNKSDPSSFFHESMHMFIYMEGLFAKESGLDTNQKAILEHVGAESFETMTVEQHEILAESFEAYLMEGKAPSVRLADAFNIIRSWMLSIYKSIRSLPNQKLDDNLREIFDKMLATETEIAQFTASPEYKQLFKSKEQAGMTDAQWEKYIQDIDKRKKRSETSVMDKIIKQIKNRRTREWKKEKAPLVAAQKERLSKLPVYQILDNAKVEKMDTAAVKDIIGDNPVLLGKLIGKHKNGGIDPAIYSEAYEYNSPEQMFQDIEQTEALSIASEKAAEAQMVAKYGDILNDGSMEREIHESLHSSSNVDILLAEIQALNKRTADINIPRLKYDAKLTIGKMTSSEIKPDRFRRLERAAALRAERAEATAQKMQEAYDTALNKKKRNEKEEAIVKKGKPPTADKLRQDAKLEQLANHYLFKEASAVKAESTKWKKYIDGVRKRDYSPKDVDADHINAMKLIANLYRDQRKGKKADEQTKKDLSNVVAFYNAQMVGAKDAEGNDIMPNSRIQLLDPQVADVIELSATGRMDQFEFRHYKDMTMDELRGVYHNLKNLRHSGGKLKSDDSSNRDAIAETTEAVVGSRKLKDNGRGDTARGDEIKDLGKGFIAGLSSLRNKTRMLDGGDEYGANFNHVFMSVEEGHNTELRLKRELFERFETEIKDIHEVAINKGSSGNKSITLVSGRKFTMHREGRFMMALYWGTESSRKAIIDGHGITESEAMQMMSFMTESELKLVNSIWKLNESMWTELAATAIEHKGVAPPKLAATPFTVNGIQMTGGHQTIFYKGQGTDYDLDAEKSFYDALSPPQAKASKERVGSGGREVDLNKDNITRAIDDTLHYIAFQPVSVKIAAILKNKEYKKQIVNRFGQPFLDSYIKTVKNVTHGRPDPESQKFLSNVFRILRRAKTYGVLHFSIRNAVQQTSSIPQVLQQIKQNGGTTKDFVEAAAMFAQAANPFGGNDNINMVNQKSEFMANRSQLVNREANEFVSKLAIGGKMESMWKAYTDKGFFLQTKMDNLLAYPVWYATYNKELRNGQSEKVAISQADTAVAESVGSGADLHLGEHFQSTNTQFVKVVTQFGSWFNNMYNRVYRDTEGFNSFEHKTRVLNAMFTVPVISAFIAAAVVADFPEEDESFGLWAGKVYASYMVGMIPVARDLFSSFLGWQNMGTLERGVSTFPKLANLASKVADEEEIDIKSTSTAIKLVSTVVPLSGAGQVARILDYVDSANEGNEDDNAFTGTYKAVVKGPTRN